MKVLLTGGAGFMGSQLTRTLVGAGCDVTVLDCLSYAGRRQHLEGVPCELIVGDVCDSQAVGLAMKNAELVIHAAAESHVARSLKAPSDFIRTNITGTHVVLEAARQQKVDRFLYISTDEVFGSAPPGIAFDIDAPMRPGNPYAASKVGGEALVHAWRHSFGYPASIVRCTNNYGPRQHPEKAIPCWTIAAASGGSIPVHGDGLAIRDWLFVEDFCRGILAAVNSWRPAATWHFAGQQHRQNRFIAQQISTMFGGVALSFGPDRQGQDARYSLDDARTRQELSWSPQVSLLSGLEQTVAWYQEHGSRAWS